MSYIWKILRRYSLGLFAAILTVVLSNSVFIHHTNTAVIAAVSSTSTSTAELVQAEKQEYQRGHTKQLQRGSATN